MRAMARCIPFACLLLCALHSPALAGGRPNILFFFPDELRFDWGGLHNNPYYSATELPLYTPHINEIAANGTRLTRAFVGSPVCAPSRACLASGRNYDENTVPTNFHNDFDAGNVKTFYKVLRDDAGYHTMTAGRDDLDKTQGPGPDGKTHTEALGFSDAIRCAGSTDVTNGPPHEPFGLFLKSQMVRNETVRKRYNVSDLFQLQAKRFAELGHARPGDEHGPFGSYAIPDPMPLPDEGYQDNWIGQQALTLLRRRPRDKPFFLQVSHQAPHPPMDITAGMMAANRLRERKFPAAEMNAVVPESTVTMGRQNYAAKIERLDYWLGAYKALLAEQQALEETIICISSDHGEMLFDRSTTAKEKPWSSASSVPLICSGPGLASNVVSDHPVSTIDLAPTFLEMAGVLHRAPQNMSRHSLLDVFSGRTKSPSRRVVRFGLDNFRGIVQYVNSTCILKFFCCAGDRHASGLCPGSTKNDSAGFLPGVDEHHLFNIAVDRFERPSSDLRNTHPDLVQQFASMLPPPHETEPSGPSPSCGQRCGYRWQGCRLTPHMLNNIVV